MKRYSRIELCPDYFSWDEASKLAGANVPIWREFGYWVMICEI